MLRKDEYEFVPNGPISKDMVVKRGIKDNEEINFSEYHYNIVIEGDIGERATVTAPFNITVNGSIGKESTVLSEKGSIITQGCIHDNAIIKAARRIQADSVYEAVTLEASDNISTGNIGEHCKLISSHGVIKADNIGKHTQIEAWGAVTVKDVAEYAKIKSNKFEAYLGNIADHVQVAAFLSVSFKSVTPLTSLTTETGELRVQMDSAERAFSLYKPNSNVVPGGSTTIQQQTTGNISITVKGAELDSIETNIGAISLEMLKNSIGALNSGMVNTTFQVREKKVGSAIITTNNNTDGVTYNIEGRKFGSK